MFILHILHDYLLSMGKLKLFFYTVKQLRKLAYLAPLCLDKKNKFYI